MLGSGNNTAAEHTPRDQEVIGLDPAGCWANSFTFSQLQLSQIEAVFGLFVRVVLPEGVVVKVRGLEVLDPGAAGLGLVLADGRVPLFVQFLPKVRLKNSTKLLRWDGS